MQHDDLFQPFARAVHKSNAEPEAVLRCVPPSSIAEGGTLLNQHQADVFVSEPCCNVERTQPLANSELRVTVGGD